MNACFPFPFIRTPRAVLRRSGTKLIAAVLAQVLGTVVASLLK